MSLESSLLELGFSEYEARAYIALVRAGDANGYEVAKRTGIPRANVYAVLEKLAQRHVLQRFETRNGTRYKAIVPDQLIRNLEQIHQQALGEARQEFAALPLQAETSPLFNLSGPDELFKKAQLLLDTADTELLVAIQPPEAATLAAPLRAARERGVAITTLCMQCCPTECGGCQGSIHRYCLAPSDGTRWLLLVADEQSMLAGEIGSYGATAFTTEHRLITELTASYIRQSLALATLSDDLGDEFVGLLSSHARQILDALHPEGGFLAHLRSMSRTTE